MAQIAELEAVAHERGSRESRGKFYEQRRADAANGDVFWPLEMSLVETAVRQYGYSHGRQKPHEVPIVMGEIVKRFPGTPMAKVAQGHIDRAMVLVEKELFEKLPENFMDMPTVSELEKRREAGEPSPVPASESKFKPAADDSDIATREANSSHQYLWLAGLFGYHHCERCSVCAETAKMMISNGRYCFT